MESQYLRLGAQSRRLKVRKWTNIQTKSLTYEPRHDISNDVVYATSKASDQPAHTRSLIRAFACRLLFCFCCFTPQVNSYGHGRTVSSPNHTFSWVSLNKQLTSTSCTYFRLSLECSMTVKLLTEHHLEFIYLRGGCTGSSESIRVKVPHCWQSHVAAHIVPLDSCTHMV